MAGSPRNVAVSHFALELGGTVIGFARQVSGGGAHADLINVGTREFSVRQLGPVRFDDLVLTLGGGLARDFQVWVTDTLRGDLYRRDGAVLACDSSYQVVSRLEWSFGLISAVSFPALDASSKEQAVLTVKISPEATRRVGGDGSRVKLIDSPQSWLASSFLLQIGGLETACANVSRIDAISITQTVQVHPTGGGRLPQLEPGRRSLSDLVVHLPESRAGQFYDWFKRIVEEGGHSAIQQTSGSLDFLSPNKRTALLSLRFDNILPYSVSRPSSTHGAELRIAEVKMSYDSMELSAP